MYSTALEPFTARDGENLALYEWPFEAWASEMGDDAPPPRGVVLIVHGLGEHAVRYDAVARRLMDWGYAVRAYDQRGHGESGGRRGALPSEGALLYDLAEIVDDTRMRCLRLPNAGAAGTDNPHKLLPLILLGHSMGGLLAARFVSLGVRPVAGLVMSSPALDPGLTAWQKFRLSLGQKFAPDFCVGNGLDPRMLCRNREIVQAYLADRLVHKKISPRLANFMARNGPATIAAAPQWRLPTLLMYAGADRIVNPAGSRAFAAAATPGVVSSKCFDGMYHEIFNEPDAEPVFDTLKDWLHATF